MKMNDDCIEVKDVACCPKYLDIWVTVKFSWKSNSKTSPGVLSIEIHIRKTLLISKLKYFEVIEKKMFPALHSDHPINL